MPWACITFFIVNSDFYLDSWGELILMLLNYDLKSSKFVWNRKMARVKLENKMKIPMNHTKYSCKHFIKILKIFDQ
jgi:hypothetical protein